MLEAFLLIFMVVMLGTLVNSLVSITNSVREIRALRRYEKLVHRVRLKPTHPAGYLYGKWLPYSRYFIAGALQNGVAVEIYFLEEK